MNRLERTQEIPASAAAVWAVLGDFMHVDQISPGITSVDALTEGENGVGSRRRCHFNNNTSLVEEVTRWQAERGFQVRLSEMNAMPLQAANADAAIEALGENRSRVTWGFDFQTKYGPLGWLMGKTLLPVMTGKAIDGNLQGLAEMVQSRG